MVPVLFITAVLLSWCHLSPSMMRHHMRLLFLILGSAFSDAVVCHPPPWWSFLLHVLALMLSLWLYQNR